MEGKARPSGADRGAEIAGNGRYRTGIDRYDRRFMPRQLKRVAEPLNKSEVMLLDPRNTDFSQEIEGLGGGSNRDKVWHDIESARIGRSLATRSIGRSMNVHVADP